MIGAPEDNPGSGPNAGPGPDADRTAPPVKRQRPDDAAEAQPHNADVVERSRKTEPPAPIEIAEETKDRILP
ncbi:hypothetical protein GCM10007973_15690 [Polymorphobacter multimanifer]|nr:hypothetical protein GCM10007973_15690 [Polymorphobacter multimanifer]